MELNNIKGVIFDYGGTIDSHGDHWSEIIWDGYCKYNVPVNKETFREAYVYAERALAKHPYIKPEHNFQDLMRIKLRIELDYLVEQNILTSEQTECSDSIADYCYQQAKGTVAEARPIIAEIAQKYPTVLVSNFYGNIDTILNDFGINVYFRHVIESAVVGVRKPDPEIFNLGIKALNIPAENIVVIGDSFKKDIAPAQSLGCQTIWIKGKGWTDDEASISHPHIITSLNELRNLILD